MIGGLIFKLKGLSTSLENILPFLAALCLGWIGSVFLSISFLFSTCIKAVPFTLPLIKFYLEIANFRVIELFCVICGLKGKAKFSMSVMIACH